MIGSLVSPRFVGRDAELARVREAAGGVLDGTPVTMLVAGEAGVGKSRLVAELTAGFVADGWRVLTGQCVELGGDGLTLAPLADVLRTLARTTAPDDLDRFLGAARRGLVWLLPELGDELPPLTGEASQAQLLELVLAMLTRVAADRPLLLVVEDLHWADRSTLELVAFLVRALGGARVMLLVTYRSDELHRRHPLRPLLSTWERGRSVLRVELPRLTRDEVAEQLAGILGEAPAPEVADIVFERSQGNAYFVEEVFGVIDVGRDPGELPPSLRDVLLTHLELLPEEAQRVVRAASAAGSSVPERLLETVVDLDRDRLATALREIVEHHLLLVDDSIPGYAFRHELTRDAVYHDMLPGERVQLHAAYGEALTAEPGLAGRAVAPLLAHHWYAALDLPRALEAALAAGRGSVRHAPADAVTHFERALEVWPRVPDAESLAGVDHVDVLLEAGTAAYLAGRSDRSIQLVDQALAEQQQEGPVDVRRAMILASRARSLRDTGRESEGYDVLLEALALAGDQPTPARANVLAALANATLRLGALVPCAAYGEQAVVAARDAGVLAPEADGLVSLGIAWVNLDRHEEGLDAIRRGIEQATELGDATIATRGYVNLSDGLEGLCRHDEAVAAARAGRAYAEEFGGSRYTRAYLAGNLAEPLLRLGRWDEARAVITEELASDRAGFFSATLLELLAELALFRGELTEARRLLDETVRVLAGDTDLQFTLSLAFIEAELARAQGDPQAALDVLEGVAEPDPVYPRYRWPLVWAAARSSAELRTRLRDRREEPPPWLDERDAAWRAVADTLSGETTHSRAYRALAGAELGDPAYGWDSALEASREAADPHLVAYALLRRAEEATSSGDRTTAEAALRESLAIARELRTEPLVTAGELLARRGRLDVSAEPAVTLEKADVAGGLEQLGLTEREHDVLGLIAGGRANADIARELFISPKTVSVHVSNILAKLQVRSRVEAAAIAHRHGLLGPER